MVETDPNYHYMRGLNRLQQFIAATQYDWGRRNWIGRTIDAAGYQSAPQCSVYSRLRLRGW